MSKHYKKIISIILVLLMTLSSFSISSAQTTDYQNNWASEKITEWIGNGLIKGYDANTFKPDSSITRSEFAALVNRSFGFTTKAATDFKDVSDNAWYATDIEKAKAAGYISGYEDNTIRPENPITREEAACIISRIITVNAPEGFANLPVFTDNAKISSWSREAVSAVMTKAIISGYPDKTFKPSNEITRAETVVMLDRALQISKKITAYKEAKVYGPSAGAETVTGDAVIAAAGSQLQNMTIAGDLTISDLVGEGNVTLKNVNVKGTVYIKGGGANSIHLDNCSMPAVVVNKSGVRVVAEGTTIVQEIRLISGATIAEQGISGEGFVNLFVSQYAPAGISASLNGNFNNVTINADQTRVAVSGGMIVKMLVAEGADGTALNLSNGVIVTTLNINSRVAVTGTGIITTAVNTVTGSTFETQPAATTSTGTGTGSGTGTGGGGGTAALNFLSISLVPAGSLTAVPVNPTFKITFDRGLRDNFTSNQKCFAIYQESSSTNILKTSEVTMISVPAGTEDTEKSNMYLSPTNLIAGKTYKIFISKDFKANNGNTLGADQIIEFTVAGSSGGGGDTVTAAISGTITTATEADIVAGGKTIVITLTNGTFGTQIASQEAKRDGLFNGLTAGTESAEWTKVIDALKASDATLPITRDSDIQVTITLPAVAGFDIAGNQIITVNIPSGSISGVSTTVTASSTVTITPVVTAAISGTITTATEADIVAGGKTIIITLAGGTYASQIASLEAKRDQLFDGLTAGSETAEWTKVIDALKASDATLPITRDSDTQVTITLPAVAGFNIADNQTITVNISPSPTRLISGIGSTVTATPAITITPTSTAPVLSAAISGTITTATEADIVAGGKTIVITLTNGAFGTQIASLESKRDGLFNGLTAGSETAEWTKVIDALKASDATLPITRDSDTQVTITLPAVAGFNITGNQIITVNIPSGSITGVATTLTAAPTITVTATGTDPVLSAAISGTITTATEADIAAGGKTIVITLTNGTFGTQIASQEAKRDGLFDGLAAGTESAEWAKVIAALKASDATLPITRDSDTKVTITLPAVAGFDIAANQTITVNIPAGSISGVSTTVTATPALTIAPMVTAAISGTITTATEADIAAGGKTIVITLTNGSFATQIASQEAKRDGLFDGLAVGTEPTEWAKVIAALKASDATLPITRDSATQVTITLPAVAGFDIAADQTITLNIPSGSISGVAATIMAAPTITVTAVPI